MKTQIDIAKEISLKKAKDSDISYIYALYKEEIQTSSWSEDDFQKFILEKYNDIFCIMLNKKCVGFIMTTSIIPESDLINIAVQKPLQSMGIGKAALLCLNDVMKKRGVKNIYLEVRKSSKALDFYLKSGYKITSFRKKYYLDDEDAVLMEKHI